MPSPITRRIEARARRPRRAPGPAPARPWRCRRPIWLDPSAPMAAVGRVGKRRLGRRSPGDRRRRASRAPGLGRGLAALLLRSVPDRPGRRPAPTGVAERRPRAAPAGEARARMTSPPLADHMGVSGRRLPDGVRGSERPRPAAFLPCGGARVSRCCSPRHDTDNTEALAVCQRGGLRRLGRCARAASEAQGPSPQADEVEIAGEVPRPRRTRLTRAPARSGRA